MEFNIDLRTILLTLVLGNLFIVILIMSYTFRREKNEAITIFVTAKWFKVIGWSLICLRQIITNFFSISVANTLLILGSSLEAVAILAILERLNKKMKTIYSFITISAILLFNYIFIFIHVESLRFAAVFISSLIIYAFPTYYLIREKNASLLRRVIGYMLYALIIAMAYQVFTAIKADSTFTVFGSNQVTSWTFVAIYISMVLGNTGFVLLAKEQSDLELVRMANYDELTKTLNRRSFISQAEKIISLFTRKKEPISFILIDLDCFKEINDTYGHNIGDLVLIDFSLKIKAQLRAYDLFGRFGGEEFAILLPDADIQGSDEVAERLRKTIERGSMIGNTEIKYTISLGIITLIPDDKTKVDLLYKLSDEVLYKAKQNGRNCIIRACIEENTEK